MEGNECGCLRLRERGLIGGGTVLISPNERKEKMERHADRRLMIHISDAEFFSALKAEYRVRFMRGGNFERGWRAVAEHFAEREEPEPLDNWFSTGSRADGKGIIEKADKLLQHEITGWHSTTFRFGKKIDFNADYGQSGSYGFHYLGWLTALGQAYVLTGDEKYVRGFDDIFSQWYDQRDRVGFRIGRLDPIWYELGCGGRTVVLVGLYYLFRESGELRLSTVKKLWKTFLGHARWLYQHERKGYQDGNWQVIGCSSLLLLGYFFPEFTESTRWFKLGKQRLLEHCERDFYPDGCYSERCPGYGTIGMRFLPMLRGLFDRIGAKSEEKRKVSRRMRQAYRWFLLTSTPLATSPATGDSGYVQLEGFLKEGARLTGDGTLLYPIRKELEDEDASSLPIPARPEVDSANLPSGFAIMRTGWERDDIYMMINYGEYGGGHTHNHCLDFELFAFGEGLALDTSRFDSYDNPLDAYFRSARAHNQVVVNDADMDRVNLNVRNVLWHSDNSVDFFSAEHDGYLKSHGVILTRKVIFVKPSFFLVIDLIMEKVRHHRYIWYVHSQYPFRANKSSFVAGRGPGLLVLPARPDEVRHIQRGVGYTKKDWRAVGVFPNRYWLGLEKFDFYKYFHTYAVLLMPFRKDLPRVKLTPLPVYDTGKKEVSRQEAEAFLIRYGRRQYIVAVSHRRPARRTYGEVSTDAVMAVFEKDRDTWLKLSSCGR